MRSFIRKGRGEEKSIGPGEQREGEELEGEPKWAEDFLLKGSFPSGLTRVLSEFILPGDRGCPA